MDITLIASMELDRTKPFDHKILVKDSTGYVMEEISVTQIAGLEKLMKLNKAWFEALDKIEKEKP